MRRLQEEVAKAAEFSGDPGYRHGRDIVAGVDQAFPHPEAIISAAVSMSGDSIHDRSHERDSPPISYIPGLLAFREGPTAISAIENLEDAPAVILVDGNGRIHPRQAGLATHLGVVLDIPTVGVAKSLLCGEPTESIDDLEAGESVPIEATGDVSGSDGEVIGYAVQTRQFKGDSRHINPLFVSPGHHVGPDTAVDIVLETTGEYKLPVPLHTADRYVSQLATNG